MLSLLYAVFIANIESTWYKENFKMWVQYNLTKMLVYSTYNIIIFFYNDKCN